MPLGVEGVDVAPAPGRHLPPSPYVELLAPRRRPGFTVTPASATWDLTVFGLRGVRRAFASVPSTQLGAFLSQLEAGRLDGLLSGFLDAPPTDSVLVAHDQTPEPGLGTTRYPGDMLTRRGQHGRSHDHHRDRRGFTA